MPTNNNIELRSEEVQEIMSRPPNWMIRWGITLVFVLILLFVFLSWFIKYPDIITGKVMLTTAAPPVKLVVKMPGEIDHINVKDNSLVFQNQPIASIRSSLSLEAREVLSKEIQIIQNHLKNATLDKYESKVTGLVFGEIETNYLSLLIALKNYKNLIANNNLAFNIENTNDQIKNQKALLNLTTKQIGNTEKLMANADNKFNADKVLFDKGIISQSDFFEREKSHKLSIADIQNLEKNKIQTSITITDLEKHLHQLKYDFETQKRTYEQEITSNLFIIENLLSTWKQSYEITAPIAGKVAFLQTLSKNQFIEQGKSIFAIIPNNEDYIAYITIEKTGYGKVRVGQKVMLKIDNYPFYEYGQLEGEIQSVSVIPSEDQYLVNVKMINGLISTYNKELKFSPEMSGSAEIITEDLRITDRIFNQFRKIFK